MAEFHSTGMGRKFYESDVPRIATALEKIASEFTTKPKTCELEGCDKPLGTLCPQHTLEETDGAVVVDMVWILMRSGSVVEVKASEAGARATLREWIESVRDINRASYARTSLEKWDGKKSTQIGEYWTVEVAVVSL